MRCILHRVDLFVNPFAKKICVFFHISVVNAEERMQRISIWYEAITDIPQMMPQILSFLMDSPCIVYSQKSRRKMLEAVLYYFIIISQLQLDCRAISKQLHSFSGNTEISACGDQRFIAAGFFEKRFAQNGLRVMP